MFGPGRNWHSASTSLNSCGVIHRFSITSMRRAQGSTPPKLRSETQANARKISTIEPGLTGAAEASG